MAKFIVKPENRQNFHEKINNSTVVKNKSNNVFGLSQINLSAPHH